jgi:hypothetical protein
MTESNKKRPLSPADYLRLVAQPRHKLDAHVELVRGLMGAGFSDYRIWRYLGDEYGITIGRATVNRFCMALREGRICGAKVRSAATGGVGNAPPKPTPKAALTPPPSVHPLQEPRPVVGQSPVSGADLVFATVDERRPATSVEIGPSGGEVSPALEMGELDAIPAPNSTSEHARNDRPAPAAFESEPNLIEPKMASAQTPDWVPGTIVRRFEISSTEGTRLLGNYRRRMAEEYDAETTKQERSNDEHDEVRKQ